MYGLNDEKDNTFKKSLAIQGWSGPQKILGSGNSSLRIYLKWPIPLSVALIFHSPISLFLSVSLSIHLTICNSLSDAQHRLGLIALAYANNKIY